MGLASAQPVPVVMLHTFSGSDGANPNTPLLSVSSGDVGGTTSGGGLWSWGTIFRISRTGTFASLYSFLGLGDGAQPQRLVLGADGAVHGTTADVLRSRRSPIHGAFFRIAPSGGLTTLYVFSVLTDGYCPSDLVVGPDRYFYGATRGGGAAGFGTAFRLDTHGRASCTCSRAPASRSSRRSCRVTTAICTAWRNWVLSA